VGSIPTRGANMIKKEELKINRHYHCLQDAEFNSSGIGMWDGEKFLFSTFVGNNFVTVMVDYEDARPIKPFDEYCN